MKLRKLLTPALFILCLSGAGGPAQAQSKVALHSGALMSEWNRVKSNSGAYSTSQARTSEIPAIRFSAQVPGLGAIDAKLTSKRNKTWRSYFRQGNSRLEDKSPLLLLRGQLNFPGSRKKSVPVAAAMLRQRGKDILRINFAAKRNRNSTFTRFYELELVPRHNTNAYSARLKTVPSTALREKLCEADLKFPALAASSLPQTSPATLRVIEISTEADYDYYQIYGSSSNSQIASVMNSAEAIYEAELSLTYSVIRQEVITSSADNYPSANSEVLLYDFRGYTNSANQLGTADVYHLFTGKDLNSGVIGLAFTGVVCVEPTYSFGLSQHVSSTIDYITFAHELGHNFNATHDTSLPASLMYPAAGPGQTSFSSLSRSEISSFVSSYGSCLSTTQSGSPTPTPEPGATPAPTAPPDDGGGGGGGGGSGADPGDDPNLPDLNLSGSLSKSGVFTGTLTLSGNSGSSTCEVSLMIARGTSFSSTYLVDLSSGNINSATLQISLPLGVKASKAKENLQVLLKGLYYCPDSSEAAVSNVLKLKPAKVSSKKRVTKSAWIKKFVSLARQAVSQSARRRR